MFSLITIFVRCPSSRLLTSEKGEDHQNLKFRIDLQDQIEPLQFSLSSCTLLGFVGYTLYTAKYFHFAHFSLDNHLAGHQPQKTRELRT